ncbi:MAG TPA: phosphoribosylformylglycinamidine synthase subunit PurL [Elusimicrobiota bacterium]|nr:phosphoribosylformylglycinamidine synthase subunit PurL [Elusimicrobiota bacterium]
MKSSVLTPSAVPPRAAAAQRMAEGFLRLSARGLSELSRRSLWSLSGQELLAAQAYFKKEGRDPTWAEMETVAQYWSEHCRHKTFNSPIAYSDNGRTRRIKSLFAETVAKATRDLKKPWCLSTFKDNAGIVSFGKSGKWALALKAETHNHPCALEPYGGAATGLGGVVRDVLAAGLGAKPVLATDVFCFGRPDDRGPLPEGALPPLRGLLSAVAGVGDYGNRLGIPLAGGGLWFEDGYRLTPLVFAGCAGILPRWAAGKKALPGDLIVAAGGRTGKDGIHGATFSSAELNGSAHAALQIGHAINEKKLLDALLRARDEKLYRFVTDCGAGGFSCAVTELAQAAGGARVDMEKAPLKTGDLEPWEIWLSESQERMVLAVPPSSLRALEKVFAAASCETAVLGEITRGGRITVEHGGARVADLSLDFLENGLPLAERKAVWKTPKAAKAAKPSFKSGAGTRCADILARALAHPNVCSRESVVRRYDYEVQAGTVIKPLQGVKHDGPGDACVIWPRAAVGESEGFSGFALAHGLNPSYGKIDPYWMAMACVDEALRNLVCVGADISQTALLDNFCWGSPDNPEILGSLVRAALGCYDAAKGFEAPFVSGKDSLFNEAKGASGKNVAVPGTLLITAAAPVRDVRKSVTMDVKAPGNPLYLLGWTSADLAGSLCAEILGVEGAGLPRVEPAAALKGFRAVLAAMDKGLVLSAHDLSEGGLAVAAAEMAFSGEFGLRLDLDAIACKGVIYSPEFLLFSESPSRILLEVPADREAEFVRATKSAPALRCVGRTIANPVLKVKGLDGLSVMEEPISALKAGWQKTLSEALA